jgi:hypothetical protein
VMLRILQESKANHFNGVVTRDDHWFRYFYPCSKMFSRSPAEFIEDLSNYNHINGSFVSILRPYELGRGETPHW